MRTTALALTMVAAVSSCAASTSSVVIPKAAAGAPKVAMLPLEGPFGSEATDMLTENLAEAGIATVERAKVIPMIAVDTDISPDEPAGVRSLGQYGQKLGVNYLFTGTVSTTSGPLYSYAHVFITLRLVDARTGQTRWIGRYGNPGWSSAMSTQGDLKRGARDIVKEFIKSGGPAILND